MPETVPVRKVNGLPRASFSRNLAIQALPLAMCLAPPPALRDFHPIESAHAERTSYGLALKQRALFLLAFFFVLRYAQNVDFLKIGELAGFYRKIPVT